MSAADPYYRAESDPMSPEDSVGVLRDETNHRTFEGAALLHKAVDALEGANVSAAASVPVGGLTVPSEIAPVYDFTSISNAQQRVAASHNDPEQRKTGDTDVQEAA